jgi:hypothetical protein
VLLGGAAVGGLVLRIWTYRSQAATPNGDEAVVGLMVRHALDGELTTFFWGQDYGGTQEVLLTVPVFFVAGSGWLTLRLVPIVLTAVAAVLVWRIGRRILGEPAAAVAGALFWIWPPIDLLRLTQQQGFYASNVVYCALLLLLALRLVERPDRRRAAAFGLVLGLAVWQTAQIVPVATPIVIWILWRQRRELPRLWPAVPAAAIGALPFLVWNVMHDWRSLSEGSSGDVEQYLRSLRLFASPVLPMTLGLRAPFSAEPIVPRPLMYLLYAALLALFAVGAVRTRRQPVSMLYLVAALFPFLYALSHKTLLSLEPRFVVVATPVLVLLVAQAVRGFASAVAVLATAAVVSIFGVHSMNGWFLAVPPVQPKNWLGPRVTYHLVPRDLGPLADALDRLHLDRVYANYWLAYRLTFDTDERIIAAESNFTGIEVEGGQAVPTTDAEVRYPPYQAAVRRARHGFVFAREAPKPAILPALERYGYRPHDAGRYVVYSRQ